MNKFFTTSPIFETPGLAFVRLAVGTFMIYHGWEIFSTSKIDEYLQWDMFKNVSSGKMWVYAGKTSELICGVLLLTGLFTRVAALILVTTMTYISFFVGHGKIWYEDQHPFLFVLLGLVFLVTGGGKWSMDHLLFNKRQHA